MIAVDTNILVHAHRAAINHQIDFLFQQLADVPGIVQRPPRPLAHVSKVDDGEHPPRDSTADTDEPEDEKQIQLALSLQLHEAKLDNF